MFGERSRNQARRRGGRAGTLALALVAMLCLSGFSAALATARDFEVPTFVAPGRNQDQSPSTTAGSHPFELENYFAVNRATTAEELPGGGHEGPSANVKDLALNLPAGMALNAAAFPQCGQEVFNGGNCSAATQVGVATVGLADGQGTITTPIFNLAPPPGLPAQFAYRVLLSAVRINFQIRSGTDYGLSANLSGLSEAFGLMTSSVEIWGVPGEPAHDPLRYTGAGAPAPGPYPEPAPFRSLLSNPTSCGGPLVTTMEADTWQLPSQITSAADFEAPAMVGCSQLDFDPTIEAKPTTNLGDSPTGLAVKLTTPQNKNAEGLATAQLRQAKITLPAGLTINPSLANGLGACSTQQIGYTGPASERQLLRYDLPPGAFSGSFTVTYSGQSTGPIAATASRAEVTAALEGLPGLAGNISLSGATGGWMVNFGGALAGTDVALLGGAVTENPSQKVAVTGEAGGFKLDFAGESTVELPFDASAAAVQEALRELPAIGLGNLFPGNVFVAFSGEKGLTRTYEVTFAQDLAGTQPRMTATSTLTGAGAGVVVTPVLPPTPRQLSVARIGGIAPGTPQFTTAPATCPDNSKLGTARIDAAGVSSRPLEGILYLATPHQNPFNSLLAFYLSVNDPQSGTVIKLPGLIEADPGTGQLTATISEFPQLPLEDIQLEFIKGSAAPFKTGIACGNYVVNADMTPWTAPESAVGHVKDSFAIEKGAGALACVKSEASAPNTPKFEAGTFEPTGGTYSPFTLKLTRADGTQQLSGLETTLPKGLLANLTGIPYCSDSALASAAVESGRQEQSASSCPAASRVGTVNTSAGAGPAPYFVEGGVYLAGPYKGAPLSLAAITPAVGGPFDLGDVVIRVALYIDPESTQIRALSDPLPSVLQGIPLELRSVVVNLDRAQFAVNPTACASTPITARTTAVSGQGLALAEHFQVGECGKLGFKPKLSLSLKGSTKAKGNPALTALFRNRSGDANLSLASFALPKSERLDNSHIKVESVCSTAQFAASQCPAGSVYGTAKLISPLFGKPLQGQVYLRSSKNSLPDLVADLRGQIHLVLGARLATAKGGGLRAGFEHVPDLPISEFALQLQGGKKGLIKNNANLCAHPAKAAVVLAGQNGKSIEQKQALGSTCKKARKSAKGKGHSGSGAGK
jgi:hypothetical protein